KVLSTDNSADVRYIAVKALKAHIPDLQNADAQKIIVRPDTVSTLGSVFGTSPPRDEAGERRFQQYEREQWMRRPEQDLVRYLDDDRLNRSAYCALHLRFFEKYKAQLRVDIDDNYKSYFARFIERLEGTYSAELTDSYRK